MEGTTAGGLKDIIDTATKGVFRANTFGRAGTIAECNFGNVIRATSKGLSTSNLTAAAGIFTCSGVYHKN